MGKFTKFDEWEKSKNPVQEEETQTSEVNAELLAQIADLVAKRKTHIKNKDDFEVQILDIDIKVLKSELEINELREKRKQLTGAKEISLNRRREAKNKD